MALLVGIRVGGAAHARGVRVLLLPPAPGPGAATRRRPSALRPGPAGCRPRGHASLATPGARPTPPPTASRSGTRRRRSRQPATKSGHHQASAKTRRGEGGGARRVEPLGRSPHGGLGSALRVCRQGVARRKTAPAHLCGGGLVATASCGARLCRRRPRGRGSSMRQPRRTPRVTPPGRASPPLLGLHHRARRAAGMPKRRMPLPRPRRASDAPFSSRAAAVFKSENYSRQATYIIPHGRGRPGRDVATLRG